MFRCSNEEIRARGFYDVGGVYRVRCMPTVEGEWEARTESDCAALDGRTARFTCIAPAPGNHGPVGVADTYHLAHADGARHVSIGTTCYAWLHQPLALQEQTLETLRTAPFNKLRMCVFPKNYTWCKNEPEVFPYEKTPDGAWDFARFNAAFFRHFEQRIGQLAELGIEADIILFHPYDFGRWGFDEMPAEADDRYLRYVVARFAAFRNVWWSMANEFDLMKSKTDADWEAVRPPGPERGPLRSSPLNPPVPPLLRPQPPLDHPLQPPDRAPTR